MSRPLPFVEALAHGIHVIDTGFHRPRFDASYLIVEAGRAAFVDAGTNHSLPRLLEALDAADLAPSAVDYVIATHVHLDHAGGVGALMRELPDARLVVHPRGARHMIDPSHLVAGATAVYGAAEVERSYGAIVPVEAARVIESSDGMTLTLAGRPLVFIDTPGHAMHHHCVWDAASRGFFTGDTFGLSYREFDAPAGAWVMPTTTPVQFQPDALRHSIGRMLSYAPERMYLTHYGQVEDVPRLAALLLGQLDEMVALGRSIAPGPQRKVALAEGLAQIHLTSLQRHGAPVDEAQVRALLALDLELNAQGIDIWLERMEARV